VYAKLMTIIILVGTGFLIACATDEPEKSKNKKKNSHESLKSSNTAVNKIPHKLKRFSKSKKLLKKIYVGRQIGFYSGCQYEYKKVGKRKKAKVIPQSCGYRVRKNRNRGQFIEWEHVVPAWAFGHSRNCWREGDVNCKGKGRKCCGKVDPVFRAMESDMHNLRPAIGELNGDRKHFKYSMIPGEKRVYGQVDFEIDFRDRVVEPRPEVRGDIARTYFYMEQSYGVRISKRQRKLFEVWDKEDPVDEWEKLRNEKIYRLQGNRNPFIK